MKLYLYCIAVFFVFNTLQAQEILSFSENPVKYMKEAEDYVKKINRNETNDLFETFKKAYESKQIPDNRMKEIIELNNMFLYEKLPLYPYYHQVWQITLICKDRQTQDSEFSRWTSVCKEVSDYQKKGNNNNLRHYLEFLIGFLDKKALNITQSRTWYSSSQEYAMESTNGQPTILLKNVDLIGVSKNDTVRINKTSGRFNPFTEEWKGKGGSIDWRKSKMEIEKVHADFSHNYTLNLKSGDYVIDSVNLTFIPYFSSPILGKINDKLFVNVDTNAITFPRFESYNNKLKVENFAEGVKYFGGFNLYGSKIFGVGSKTDKAIMKFYNQDKQAIEARSELFVIKPKESIASKNAEISLYYDKDSITHPGVNVKYAITSRKIRFLRDEEGFSKMPFFSSFHKMEMNLDAIMWDMSKDDITFKMIGGGDQNPAVFKSNNFFRNNDYVKIQGVTEYNPLFVMKLYAEETGKRTIGAEELTKRFNKNLSLVNTRALFFNLAEEGYIIYDKQNEIVTIKDKVIDDAMASIGKKDYDVIKIKSKSTKENGTFNLKEKILDLKGVNLVSVSDSQNVVFFPKNDSLKILQNRDMDFNGNVFAGKVNLAGDKFNFIYDTFKVDLNHVDELTLHVEEINDAEKKIKLIPLKSKIEDFDGELYIDEMNNKSGKEKLDIYPQMAALTEAKVFYDNVLNGVYKRDKFKFVLKPFEIDSLDTYDPYAIDFDGRLISGNIFPDIPEHLKINPDLTLGFKTKTDEKGLSLYGKGNFKDSIILSSSGLTGKGKFDYLATQTQSKEILFYIDSLHSEVDSFLIRKTTLSGVEYPDLYSNGKTRMRWYPYSDTMKVKGLEQKFSVFENQGKLKGNILINPKEGMSANGNFDWNKAFIKSKKMLFKSTAVHADTCDLKINALDSTKLAFSNKNTRADIDFSKQWSSFKANNPTEQTVLPYNQYRTDLNEFEWDMAANVIQFQAKGGALSTLYSTRQSQDSLRFQAKTAKYNLNTALLTAYDIPYIKVGDAKIFPDSNKVVIAAEAEMQTLRNAKIIADTLTNYHTIDSVTCNINGKRNYRASGYYNFNVTGLDQKIRFSNIRLEPIDIVNKKKKKKEQELITKAEGTVKEESHFRLSSKIYYFGKVDLLGNEKNLFFNGFTKLDLNNYKDKLQWIYVNKQVDPKTIAIPYDNALNPSKQDLSVGYFLNKDVLQLSPSLFFIKDAKASPIFEPKGLFLYDDKNDEFVFGDSSKIVAGALHGNKLVYNDAKASMTATGKFKMAMNFENPFVDFTAYGQSNYEKKINKFDFTQIQNFNFLAPPIVYTNAQKIITEDAINLSDLNLLEKFAVNREALSNLGKDDDARLKIISDFDKLSSFYKTKDMISSILLANVEMIWDEYDNTFHSKGDKLGVLSIGEAQVNKILKGWVELGPRKSGDFFNVYLETSTGDYIFFSYMNNELEVLYSKQELNDALLTLKPKETMRKLKGGKSYRVYPSIPAKMENFKYRMIEANAPENQNVVLAKRKRADEYLQEELAAKEKKRIADSIRNAAIADSIQKMKLEKKEGKKSEVKEDKKNKKEEVVPEPVEDAIPDEEAPPPSGQSIYQIKMEIQKQQEEEAARQRERDEINRLREELEKQRQDQAKPPSDTIKP